MVHTLAGSLMNAPSVAYSAGLYRDHSPPELRKSGIPLSVLTPAPVNATALRAATIQRRGGGLAAFGEILRSLAAPPSPSPSQRSP